MSAPFDEAYPNISWWVDGAGWIEIGEDHHSRSMIRVLDIGGVLWEEERSYATVGEAMDEAEAFIGRWRVENGYEEGAA